MSEETQLEYERVPYTTVYVRLGTHGERVIQTGIEGQIERRLRVRFEDGVEVSREAQAERVISTPLPQVILR